MKCVLSTGDILSQVFTVFMESRNHSLDDQKGVKKQQKNGIKNLSKIADL
jgi:hypothetical protein